MSKEILQLGIDRSMGYSMRTYRRQAERLELTMMSIFDDETR